MIKTIYILEIDALSEGLLRIRGNFLNTKFCEGIL